jgi:type II restriction/modification system DNA methylase subunit YeeA
LSDNKGVKLKTCTAEVVNDELMIFDEDRNFYVYNVNNAESRRIQETVFQEKRRIIEGSLFGVDINLNSVKICCLRLWIELLKNAYYTKASGYIELETLPNIDINIKCGNSLISRFELDIDLKAELSRLKYTVQNYQEAVSKSKNAIGKNEKLELDILTKAIKDNFRGGVQNNTALSIKKGNLHGELVSLLGQGELFGLSQEELTKKQKRVNEIAQKIQEIDRQIENIENNTVYENAFEWRFEFPELLNDDGDFTGFDVVIGNPPYIQLQDNQGELADIYNGMGYECFSRSGDIYQLFYECGYKLLKEKRYLCFITSNKWMRAAYGEKTRIFFADKANPKILIDFAGQRVFESATVDVNIILLEKRANEQKTISCIIKDDCKYNMTIKNRQMFLYINT